MRTLHLTLSEKPFEVMVTGEKKMEFRLPSTWITSRLKKQYDVVKFTNGYGDNKPYFIAPYRGFWIAAANRVFTYSNGLIVDRKAGMIVILIGEIIERGNLKQGPYNTEAKHEVIKISCPCGF